MPLGGLSFWGARAYARSKTNKKPTNLTQKALPPRQNPPFRQTLYRISLSRQQERQEIQVTIEKCLMGICIELTPIDASAPKFFGFSEFLTSLALMVLAWTTTDVRYRFRIECAPIPLKGITFGVVVIVGMLTLLTDLWRTEQWLVLTNIPLTIGSWQALMGGMLLLNFFLWIWFAFIRPATYGKLNAKRFTQALEKIILKGSKEDLSIIADELTQSIKNIVTYAMKEKTSQDAHKLQKVQTHANKILELIADKNFCHAIATSSPATAITLYTEMENNNKYDIPVENFTKNLIGEAIIEKSSFIYREISGNKKPLSQALFSNYKMSEAIGTTLCPNITYVYKFDADQWKAYFLITLTVLKNYNPQEHGIYSNTLKAALDNAKQSTRDSYVLDTIPDASYNNEYAKRIITTIEFTRKFIEKINEKEAPKNIKIKTIREDLPLEEQVIAKDSIYDNVASLMLGIVIDMSRVTNPAWEKHISHFLMPLLLGHDYQAVGIEKIIQAKFRRKIYNDIKSMGKTPNQRAAREIRLILNTTDPRTPEHKRKHGSSILQKAVLGWLKRSYDRLYRNNRKIAEICLGENTVYDNTNHRIVRKYVSPSKAGKAYIHLDIDPAEPSLAPSSPARAQH